MAATFKKSLSLLLSLVLTTFLLPLPASADPVAPEEVQDDLLAQEEAVPAAEDEAAEEESDEGAEDLEPDTSWHTAGTARWKIEDGTLTIAPLEGETVGYLSFNRQTIWSIETPWSDRGGEIRAIKVESRVVPTTTYYLFSGCTALEGFDLSGLDLSNATTLSGFFYMCSSLESIDLSNVDTSRVEYMESFASGCTSLKSVDLSALDLSSVENMDRFFSGCTSLESVDFLTLDTSRVKSMNFFFRDCTALNNVDFSGIDTSSATSMSGFFYSCKALNNVDFSSIKTSNVTSMSSFFYSCTALEAVDLSGLDTSNVTSLYGFFQYCTALRSADLSVIDTSKVTDVRSLFSRCSTLENAGLSGIDTTNMEQFDSMFFDCRKLTQIDLSSFDTRHIADEQSEDVKDIFKNCFAKNITVGESFTLQKWFVNNLWYNTDDEAFLPDAIPVGVADTYTMGSEPESISIKAVGASFISVGAVLELDAEVLPQPTGGVVSWESSDESIGSVDAATGVFSAIESGSVSITATTAFMYSDGRKSTKSDTITIEVRKCVRSVSMAEASKVVYVNDEPFTLQASVDPPDAYNAALGWQSSNTAVATVDANGQVTPLSVGETTITATAGGFSDTCIVVVEDEPIIPVTSVSVDPSALTLTGQESKRLSVTVGPADATNKDVEWFSSNTAVAAVDAEGNVSAQGKGTATITAASLDGGVKATCTVTVLNPPTTATLGATPHEVRMSKSESVAITLGGALPGATESLDSAAWESSDADVLSVSGNGLSATVTGVGVGAATIAFHGTYGGGDLSASFDVDVIWDDVTSITLSETEKVLMMGSEPVELRYSIQPLSAQGAELVWKSSAAGVASVDQSGRVTPVSPGQATITVTAKGASAQCEVTVIEKPEDVVDVASIALDRTSLELTGAQSAQLTATVAPENATYKTVHWTSSDLSVAKVDATGLVTSVRKGTATITASSADGAKKATCVVTVLNPLTSISLSPASKTVSVGESFNVGLTPKGELPGDVDSVGEVTWSSSDEAVAKVTPNAMVAKVDALSAGVAEVTAATVGAGGALAASATIHVTWPAPVALTLDRHELALDVSSVPVQLSASASPAEALNAGVRWTSTDPKVVSVDETGLVRPVRAGTATVSVTLGNLKDECAITVGAVRLDAAPDSEVPGYVLVQDPATAELLRGLHVVINRNDAKEDSRLAPLLAEDQDEGMTVAESYDIHLVDDAGNRVAWNSPQSPLTVCMQMDEALLSLSEANRLGIHYVDDGFTTVEAKATQVRDGYLTFETTHFSIYALTATPYPDGTGSGDGDDGSGSGDGSGDGAGSGGSADGGSGPSRASGDVGSLPQTGDDLNLIALWILLGALLAATAACRFLAERRS